MRRGRKEICLLIKDLPSCQLPRNNAFWDEGTMLGRDQGFLQE